MTITTEALASALRSAYDEGCIDPIGDAVCDISAEHSDAIATAYQIQNVNTSYWIARGRRLIGRKIGLTSTAVQTQLGVSEPDYGMLFDDMLIDNGGLVAMSRLLQPKIEAEIAFRVSADMIEAPSSEAELVMALDRAYPALEIVDSRIRDWKIALADTVADNASSALFVIGEPVENVAGLDLTGAQMTLMQDGAKVSSGSGADCMGNPLTATLWLVRKMAEVGRPVRVGDIILSGALGPMATVVLGANYQADIGGLGKVSVRFGRDEQDS